MFDLNTYFIVKGGDIGILDATNSTKKRRNKIIKFFSFFPYDKKIIFLENITNDPIILKNNIEFKKTSPDYKDIDSEIMKNDFNKRIEYYKMVYEDIDDDEQLDYVKIYNCGKKIIFNNISGHLETLILNYLVNFKVNIKKIYISRHGESLFNVQNRIGGDPDITDNGVNYSKKLFNYISLNHKKEDIIIYTSNLIRQKILLNYLLK